MGEDTPHEYELRRRWRFMWLSCIQQVSDFEQQTQNWLDPQNSNPHWSFVEYVCSYFDDCLLTENDGGYQRKLTRGWVTPEEAAVVASWHDLFERYQSPNQDDYDDRAILADPSWRKVVAEAGRARAALLDIISDREERQFLMGDRF
jgi:hypothetical protein